MSDRKVWLDQGRIVGAYEARGGVVIAHAKPADAQVETAYFGVRLFIETLTVTAPLHEMFGEPKVRAAYARPVYRYEVTRRGDVLAVAKFLLDHIYDPGRVAELQAIIRFCEADNSPERESAREALLSARA